MTLLPPTGATHADVTDVAADGTHLVHLTATELATKTVHLPTNPIVTSIIVVYRNSAGAAVGALSAFFRLTHIMFEPRPYLSTVLSGSERSALCDRVDL
jgi:hypothetical protein